MRCSILHGKAHQSMIAKYLNIYLEEKRTGERNQSASDGMVISADSVFYSSTYVIVLVT